MQQLSSLVDTPAVFLPTHPHRQDNTGIRGAPQGHTGHSYDQVVQDDEDDSDEYEDDEYESGAVWHTCCLAVNPYPAACMHSHVY